MSHAYNYESARLRDSREAASAKSLRDSKSSGSRLSRVRLGEKSDIAPIAGGTPESVVATLAVVQPPPQPIPIPRGNP